MTDVLKQVRDNKRVKQVVSLFSVNMVSIPLGLLTSILLTSYLGASRYGDYSFIISVFSFAVMVVTFGFFQAGNRAIVLSSDKGRIRGYYGCLVAILGVLYALMTAGLILYSLFDSNVASKGLTKLLTCLSPLALATLFGRMYETVLPADNRIDLLSKIRLYPSVANFLVISVLSLFAKDIGWNKLALIFLLFTFIQLACYVYVTLRLKPDFGNLRERFSEIWHYNKSFGFNVYVGALFGVGVGYFTPILVSFFGGDNSGVGFYSLANSFAQPLLLIPATIATTHYKDFAPSASISRRLQLSTIALSVAALLALWIMVPLFIRFFFKPEFQPAIRINFFIGIGVLMHGMADFYNRFIQASGKGARLRDTAIAVGITTLVSSFLLIPKFGVYGAAYSRIISGFVYLSVIYYYYRKTCREKSRS